MTERHSAEALIALASTIMQHAGMDAGQSVVVATTLVEADLMEHGTHGLQLLPGYVRELEAGTLRGHGEYIVVQDKGAVATWDGQWSSGVWLIHQALDMAAQRARQFGIGAVSIGRAHHTACLQAYLPRMTEQGLMAIITSSDPASATVAPFGGIDPVLGPDPIAVGIPTDATPILIDMSSSITTNGMAARTLARGEKLRGEWLQDGQGRPSNDPAVLKTDPPGTLLLAGGQDHGQKGYGMALTVEALSHGLSGHGRKDHKKRWSASVFVQVIDPGAFAGLTAFANQTGHLADICHGSRPLIETAPVRLPGESALARREKALAQGVQLAPDIMEAIRPIAERFGISV